MRREHVAAKLFAAVNFIKNGDMKRAAELVAEANKDLVGWRLNTCSIDGCQRERVLYSGFCKQHQTGHEPPI